ncbi:MAG: 16S rRNA (guanine(527)-N(7))-methyltransferase RsmG [Bacteroidales bacterium]|jgi:16S rRNA (guanine527-N7)-methyltransferase|nr:16S rRNA (guanine(527)-N(7))-methyltransferase RsmG [Bacteroidales bacterium]HOL97411.1 16S rRNA (guanine(527)-N(7))-methyltransferase RsmG [Bacteroidales bacterium]HOM37166.1 16S rRNA (guanine(527)-N(7))-methyltransferase RsmG [Bacteroidales bacterium]HPD24519.1 16S rRNA (guanine(527)-N(7))-methyltransferase RsmG [Bacteroidales bacterium]HRT00125.1 16S rRNA (guanine(527)-N(7))-methyltransferase RsmG [Bacteroidales bacterium]
MREILLKYFPKITVKQIDKLLKLNEIFPEWNSKINCISRKDIQNLFINHILHSLSVAKIFNFPAGTRIVDVGTGGGFPAIPLSILFPDVIFYPVDSISKKITVVTEIANLLELENVFPINNRCENLSFKCNFVVSRAVTAFPAFYKMTKNLIDKESIEGFYPNGIIYLKGGDFDEEIKDFRDIKIYQLKEIFEYEFFETKKIIYLST